VRSRTGCSLPGIVPSNTYTCGDGAHIVIGGNSDPIFKRLMQAIGREDLANDPALATNDGRVPHTERIDAAIADWCGRHTIDVALNVLQQADVPVSKIYSAADMLTDPHFQARQMFETHQLPDGAPITIPAVVPKLSDTPGGTDWLGPELGAHTEEVLQGLGYSAAQIAALKAAGTV
jgi:formyl-CoA transferase